ncbi:MAG TPA: acetyl-CoA hydrolase/transferase C-terminal domain-containing protein [Acidimicrobiales bacterium]|nr:acetyl-CoA hydrolase/transferase C-terminal domain-containing protein [Acidimicrobiales bacterium]
MADAAALVRDRDVLGIPLGPGHPNAFLHALGTRPSFDELVVTGALLTDFYELFDRPGVRYVSGFYGPIERMLADAGGPVEFVPADFRRFAPVLEEVAPRVMATSAAPPDDDGYCSLSLHAGATVGELHRAARDPERTLIVEVSPHFPRTHGLLPGHPHRIHVNDIDVLVESDARPFALMDPPATDVDRTIASLVANYVRDGATLQTGIGGIPGTVVSLLADDVGGGYGIHSEMFTTGLMRLHQAGKVTNASKGIFADFSVTTFALGEPELYAWLADNSDVRFLPVDVVNSPDTISANVDMVSINGALAVDLAGQAVADTRDGRQFSGIGGHEDFVASSGLQLEDRSLICLRSTATVEGVVRSRITARFDAGTIITTPRHQLDVVITEYGAAELRGRTVRERAVALAQIAHPDFRDDLVAQAEVWPPT